MWFTICLYHLCILSGSGFKLHEAFNEVMCIQTQV